MASVRFLREFIEENFNGDIYDDKEAIERLWNANKTELLEWAKELGHKEPEVKPLTPEEIRDEMVDRIRGGPKAYLKELAESFEMTYDEFISNLTEYAQGFSSAVGLNFDIPSFDVDRMWDSFELVTKIAVPADRRDSPFSCSC